MDNELNFSDLNIMNPSYPLEEQAESNLISSAMEDGTVKTRQRYTKSRTTYNLSWNALPNAQKQALVNFYKNTTKGGSLPFNWLHPLDNELKLVRFAEPPTFSTRTLQYWSATVKFVEV